MGELERIGDLGHGSCGHVVKMRHGKTGTMMAVKVALTHLLPVLVSALIYLELLR